MRYTKTYIEGLILIEPKLYNDERGYFFESFNLRDFQENVGDINFVQDNQSFSKKGTLRGLHYQKGEYAQAKLLRVVSGRVLDVAVDLRKDSATYAKHFSVELSGDNHKMLFIPRGFAHGFIVLSDTAIFQYKCDNFYNPNAEAGLIWNDPSLSIDWKLREEEIIISQKDRQYPYLYDI